MITSLFWDIGIGISPIIIFLPQKRARPKEKVLLIIREVSTLNYPKQSSPVKKLYFQIWLGLQTETISIYFCLKTERQCLCLSEKGKNGFERSLVWVVPEANLAGCLHFRHNKGKSRAWLCAFYKAQ